MWAIVLASVSNLSAALVWWRGTWQSKRAFCMIFCWCSKGTFFIHIWNQLHIYFFSTQPNIVVCRLFQLFELRRATQTPWLIISELIVIGRKQSEVRIVSKLVVYHFPLVTYPEWVDIKVCMPCMGWDGHQWSSKLGDGLLPPRLSPAYVIVNSVYSINCMSWDGHWWLGMGPSLVRIDLCKSTNPRRGTLGATGRIACYNLRTANVLFAGSLFCEQS